MMWRPHTVWAVLVTAALTSASAYAQSDNKMSIPDVLKQVNGRLQSMGSLAARFTMSMSTNRGVTQYQGLAAVKGERFVVKGDGPAGTDGHPSDRLWYASDASTFQTLRGRVKQVQPVTPAHQMLADGVRSLISDPLFIVNNRKLKPAGPNTLFTPQEVRQSYRDGNTGHIIVEIDATKRSDFTTIRYEFSPDQQWALVTAQFTSGGVVVATMNATDFFQLAGSSVLLPGRIRYVREGVGDNDEMTLKSMELNWKSAPDIQLNDDNTFRLAFSADVVTPEHATAVAESIYAGKAAIAKSIGETISNLENATAPAQATSSPSSTGTAMTVEPPAEKGSGRGKANWVLLLGLTVLAIIGIAMAIMRRRTGRNRLTISKGGVTLVLVVGVGTLLGAAIMSNSSRPDSIGTTASPSSRPSQAQVAWGSVSTEVPYNGYIVAKGQRIAYRGWLSRRDGIECHRWGEGRTEQSMEFQKDFFCKYAGAGPKRALLFKQASPMLYPILYAYNLRSGKPLSIFECPDARMDLAALRLRGLDGMPARDSWLEISSAAKAAVVVAKVFLNGRLALRVTLHQRDSAQSAEEIYEYFDGNGDLAFEMGIN